MFQDKLYDYIKNCGIDLEAFIINNALTPLFSSKLPDNDNIKIIALSNRLNNKYENNIILSEISQFVDYINANAIKAVFVKGATTVYTVYDNPNDRNIGDIDVYIEYGRIKDFIGFLDKLGYYHANNGVAIEKERWEAYIDSSMHLTGFSKDISHNGEVYSILVEIHVYPFFLSSQYRVLQTEEIYDSFFDSAVVTDIAGIKLPMLPPNMNFMFMLDHFIKHICSSFEADVFDGNINNPIQVELLKLYEAKLYYEKYKEHIQVENLIKLSKKYNIQYQIDLGIHYLNQVFPDSIQGFYIDDDFLRNHHFSEIIICAEYKKYRLIDIIVQSIKTKQALIKAVYSEHDYSSYKIEVPYKKTAAPRAYFKIDHENPCNTHGTHIMRGIPFAKDDYSLAGSLCWDEKYLYINIQVTDSKFPEMHGNVLSIRLDNEKEEKGLRGFYVRIFGNEKIDEYGNKYHLVDVDNGKWLEDMNKDLFFNYSAEDNLGFAFSVVLPFEMINIKPEDGTQFKFDIILNRFEGEKLVSMSSLSCIREGFSSKYSNKIILKK